jgi:hypothetical protein
MNQIQIPAVTEHTCSVSSVASSVRSQEIRILTPAALLLILPRLPLAPQVINIYILFRRRCCSPLQVQ